MVKNQRDPWRLKFHLMPPQGWLNDPNGLCQFRGIYHIFFQYRPETASAGGNSPRVWGHYAGEDLLHLHFQGIPFTQDGLDRDGSYSGSALTEGDSLQLFYTGNIRRPGDYDYIHDGRESNTIRICSRDGVTFGPKQLLLQTADYPVFCTRHVRDPKVWKEDGQYYMVLGTRQTDEKGSALLYRSRSLEQWNFVRALTTPEPFGYMWECPDYFHLDGQSWLSVCPQGLPSETFRFQNIYQSGYFSVSGRLDEEQTLSRFTEWDMGFDFYAPQTFADESGRRLLFAWAGMPDAPWTNPTEALGWQHALTVPRQLTGHEGRILQAPVPELEKLRRNGQPLLENTEFLLEDGSGDLILSFPEQECRPWQIQVGSGLRLSWKAGILRLDLKESWGYGRTFRQLALKQCRTLRLLADTSLLEIYVNGGEQVLTTRFYPDYQGHGNRTLPIRLSCPGVSGTGWQMDAMETNRHYC